MKLIDRTGKRFTRLLVLRKDSKPKHWSCQCDCGRVTLVTGSNLDKGSTKSCGCLGREWSQGLGANKAYIALRAEKLRTHGEKARSGASQEYKIWLGMKSRCSRKSDKDYSNWGGRGIRVSLGWKASFEEFLADMGRRPSTLHSIDRIDPNKDYCKENCRWATSKEQGETKRNNLKCEVDGKTYSSLSDMCLALGLKYTTIAWRLGAGISLVDAVSQGTARMKPRRSEESYLPKLMRSS